MAGRYNIITVGSSTVDIFIDTESELIKIKTSKYEEELLAYPSGSKILIEKIRFLTGGGGTNTAVCLSRLGLKAAYLGKIGSDDNGKKIIGMLKKEKVNFIGAMGEGQSGYSLILNGLEKDRTILTYKGENDNLKIRDVDPSKLKTDWFYFSSMMGESYKTLEKLTQFARRNKIKIVFNPSNYLAEKGVGFLKNVLSFTEILVLNKEETELLVGRGTFAEMILNLEKFGPKYVVITDGKNGAYSHSGKYLYYVPAIKAKAEETTGAGDAFAASFLAGIILKNDIEFALKLGAVNASSVVQGLGAKTNLLTYSKAISAIKRVKLKVKKTKI